MSHKFTCLMAPEELQKLGLTRVVSVEETRQIVGAFSDPAEASVYCDYLNGRGSGLVIQQAASAVVTKPA